MVSSVNSSSQHAVEKPGEEDNSYDNDNVEPTGIDGLVQKLQEHTPSDGDVPESGGNVNDRD